jgi:hypothetical protein
MDSSLGGRLETGVTRIGMSPSKSGMGEIKLSKACIQTKKDIRIQEGDIIDEDKGTLPDPFLS